MQANQVGARQRAVNYYEEAERQVCSCEVKACAVFTAVISIASVVTVCYGISEFADGITVNSGAQATKGLYIVIGGLFGSALSLISCSCLCCC
ncbi:MAG: hypothetical protein JSR37_02430 [Verrucomicrobia bacterium]|nr:hypothetical protein [Verrucomicrobiota bacterium]MBS0638006.1 hypothetical protein [Verrucomicrobiota bacterium]